MISILIPTYNYTIFPLVEMLCKQIAVEGVAYEILCLDDHSTIPQEENYKINDLPHCSYEILPQNIGRSSIRNRLSQKAKFQNILFLDADTMPVNTDFLATYIRLIPTQYEVIYGGILYAAQKPSSHQMLRWTYGRNREALPVAARNKAPYISFLTLNFLIKKEVFTKVVFNETIPNLRHEDTLFSYQLQQQHVKIQHIANPVYHLGLETSSVFLAKTNDSLKNLNYLIANQLISKDYVRLAQWYAKLQFLFLPFLVAKVFQWSKNRMVNQLKSSKPSMFIFDLYRLGYFCTLKN